MKLSQLIEYNVRNNFFQKSCKNEAGRLVRDLFLCKILGLGNMCITIICFQIYDVIDLKLNIAFLSSRFPKLPKRSGKKLNI